MVTHPEELTIRRGTEEDIGFLRLMLLEAAFWRSANVNRQSHLDALEEPHLRRYIDRWGRAGDAAVVAQSGQGTSPIGAAWYRLFRPPDTGYGYIDDSTPEVSMAVIAAMRGRGVGTALLNVLANVARANGFAALCLSVEKDNPATTMYARCGYQIVGETGNAWTMKRVLIAVAEGAEP
jgi:GNAT superfamily N-acetyltransferase